MGWAPLEIGLIADEAGALPGEKVCVDNSCFGADEVAENAPPNAESEASPFPETTNALESLAVGWEGIENAVCGFGVAEGVDGVTPRGPVRAPPVLPASQSLDMF